jgi:hypothetical protein
MSLSWSPCAAVLVCGCLEPTHGELTRGEHAELVCVRLAECATHPTTVFGGDDPPLDVFNAVSCIRTVRDDGWHWVDDNVAARVLGDEPRDGFGSPRCLRALDALPCPMVGDYVSPLEVVLDACSAGGDR